MVTRDSQPINTARSLHAIAVEEPPSDGEESQDNKAEADGSRERERSAGSATKPSTPTPETAEEAAEILLETPEDLDAQQVLLKHLLHEEFDGLDYCLTESLEATGGSTALGNWRQCLWKQPNAAAVARRAEATLCSCGSVQRIALGRSDLGERSGANGRRDRR